MKLSHFQNQALQNILHSYSSGNPSALVKMAPGTGKTILAKYVLERLASQHGIHSSAYVAGTGDISFYRKQPKS